MLIREKKELGVYALYFDDIWPVTTFCVIIPKFCFFNCDLCGKSVLERLVLQKLRRKLPPPTLRCAWTTQTLGLLSLPRCHHDARLHGAAEIIKALLGVGSFHLPGRVLATLWTLSADRSVPTQPTATDEASKQQKDPLQESSKLSHLNKVPVILPPSTSHKRHLFATPTRATAKSANLFSFFCTSPTLLFSFFREKMLQWLHLILEQSRETEV